MTYLSIHANQTSTILLSLAIILFSGFLLTRITKIAKLPNVTGFIISGVLVGPHVFNLIPEALIGQMSFVSDIALAFIAFGVGRFFRKETFKETGLGILLITVFESLFAGLLIVIAMRFIFKLDWDFSLLLGAIATATAPASTMATIRQYGAKGYFVNVLLQVVALDDAVCLLAFSAAVAIVNANAEASVSALEMTLPVVFNLLALVLGFFSGYALSKLITDNRSEDNRLILPVAILLAIAGLCAMVDVSPLLACMLFGMAYINYTGDDLLFTQLEKFASPILSVFFVVSGMNLDITSFNTLGIIGAAYFIIRIAGKYAGAYLSCSFTGEPASVKNYLGLALIPQAGVAIGLAFLAKRILPDEQGDMLLTIILSSSVLYELIGPASAKLALIYSGAIPQKNKLDLHQKTE